MCPFSNTFTHKVFGQSQIIILMNVFPVTWPSQKRKTALSANNFMASHILWPKKHSKEQQCLEAALMGQLAGSTYRGIGEKSTIAWPRNIVVFHYDSKVILP